ncbi:hypothetical protein [Pseudodesulfovibrio sp. zrk46]|uniref:hypothetical protein n=1 Tax=Pseudodesulfovibrio sp. zrk46 TaxID=2725288 RepID=UPI001449AC88|nr:hypothetical protein [Pseudodesulfovibrio sp. zrk46]QJB57901.1 hypothetical protein HFN16_16515 [Pseudodesulfovibrio sp. zrk46]
MTISIGSESLISPQSGTNREARGLVRSVQSDGVFFEPEQAEEAQPQTSSISFQKELTPEEEKRLIFLQNLLAQLLTMVDGNLTDEQKERIKEIEQEMEEITGVKMRSSISKTTEKMLGEKEDDENQDKWKKHTGIDPKDAIHSREPELSKAENPGMQMLKRNSLFANLQELMDKSGGLSAIVA